MFGCHPALDRQCIGAECRGSDDRDAGQRREYLPRVCAKSTLSYCSERAMSCCSCCQRRRSAARRCARNSASTGAAKSRFQRSVQNVAVASLVRPGALASNERYDGARPANAAAHASTAWPVGDSSFSARPCPAGAERPGQRALSWSCSRCWSTRRASTSWER